MRTKFHIAGVIHQFLTGLHTKQEKKRFALEQSYEQTMLCWQTSGAQIPINMLSKSVTAAQQQPCGSHAASEIMKPLSRHSHQLSPSSAILLLKHTQYCFIKCAVLSQKVVFPSENVPNTIIQQRKTLKVPVNVPNVSHRVLRTKQNWDSTGQQD